MAVGKALSVLEYFTGRKSRRGSEGNTCLYSRGPTGNRGGDLHPPVGGMRAGAGAMGQKCRSCEHSKVIEMLRLGTASPSKAFGSCRHRREMVLFSPVYWYLLFLSPVALAFDDYRLAVM
ncbi:MAG: hypothetical protein GX811_07785 [Lentisphaerae bacterium]|jgi:hypothetical protein|nr:hypothetical protein [Lentisphaerota bacterium]